MNLTPWWRHIPFDINSITAAWAGRTLCVPPQDSASTLKALRWAIASELTENMRVYRWELAISR